MQKKILASLLVSPLAFNAFADADVPAFQGTDWDKAGFEEGQFTVDGGLITSTSGIGTLTQDVTGLPVGKYKLTFVKSENVTVTINGKEVKAVNGEYAFEMTSKGTAIIKISATDTTKGYSFEGCDLELVFDFESLYAELNDKLNNTVETIAIYEGQVPNPAIDNETAELNKKRTALIEAIGSLDPGTLEVYEKYQLWTGNGGTLATEITSLSTEVKNHNDAVAEAEKTSSIITANKQSLAKYLKPVEDMEAILRQIRPQTDFVSSECANLNEVKSDVAAYRQSIENTFSDLTKPGLTFDEKDLPALQKEVNDLKAKYDAAVANQAAFDRSNGYITGMKAVLDENINTLSGLRGIEGYEDKYKDVFNSNITACQSAINELFNEARSAQPKIEEAAANEQNYKSTVEKAKTDIADAVTALKSTVESQNRMMLEALAAVKTQQDALNKVKFDADKYPSLAADKKEIQTLIDNMTALVNKNYVGEKNDAGELVHSLKTSDYDTTTIASRIEKLKNAIGQQNDLQKYYNDTKAEIEDYLTKSDLSKYMAYDLLREKFGYAKVWSDVVNLAPGANETTVRGEIATMKTDAVQLIDDVKKILPTTQEFNNAIVTLKEGIETKKANAKKIGVTFNFDNFTTTNEGYLDITATANDWYTRFWRAFNEYTGNGLRGEFANLISEIAGYGWSAKVLEVTKNFELQSGNSFMSRVDWMLGQAQNQIYWAWPSDFFGKPDNLAATEPYKAKRTEAENKQTSGSQANELANVILNYNQADTAWIAAYNAMDKWRKEIPVMAQNQRDFNDLVNSYTGSYWNPGIQSLIGTASQYNQTNATDPAKTYYNSLINGSEATSYQSRFDKLIADMKTALETAPADASKNVTGQKAAFQKTIDDLKSELNALPGQIKANEEAHNGQLNKSTAVRDQILAYNKEVTDRLGTQRPETAQKYIEQLDALLDGGEINLTAIDRDVYNTFGQGKSKADDTRLTNAYDDVLAAAKKIMEPFAAGDKELWENLNNALKDEAAKVCSNLNVTADSVITIYNQYAFELKNQGYKAWMNDLVKGYEAKIYGFTTRIQAIRDNVKTTVEKATAAEEAVTEQWYKDNVTDVEVALYTDMRSTAKLFVDEANAEAEQFYANRTNTAENYILNEISKLVRNGVSNTEEDPRATKALENNQKALDAAKEQYDAAKANEKAIISLKMDAIAFTLDDANAAIDEQTVAMDQWISDYQTAESAVNGYLTEIRGYKFADPNTRDNAERQVVYILSYMSDVNDDATSTDPLLTRLRSFQSRLNGYKQNAENYRDQVKTSNDNNVESQELYNTYTGTTIPGYNDRLEALKQFLGDLSGARLALASGPENEINKFQSEVERLRSVLYNRKSYFEGLQGNVEHAFDVAYGSAFTAELNLIADYAAQVKAALAEVRPTLSADRIAEIEKIIATAEEFAARNPWDPDSPDFDAQKRKETIDKFAVDSDVQEKALTDALQELKASADLAGKALEALNTLYGEVDTDLNGVKIADIEELCKKLDEMEWSDTKYAEDWSKLNEVYQSYVAQLAKIKAGYEGDGNQVIAAQTNYTIALETLKSNIETLNKQVVDLTDEVNGVDKARSISEAKYAELNEQLEGFTTRLDNLEQTMSEWDVYFDFYRVVDNIRYTISRDSWTLTSNRESYVLTENSVNANAGNINTSLDNLEFNSSERYTNNKIGDVSFDEVKTALDQSIVPAVKEALEARLQKAENDLEACRNRVTQIRYYWNNQNWFGVTLETCMSDLASVRDEVKRIVEELNAIVEEANENVFVLGDLTENPDGVVNVTDVMRIIDIVGEGITYEELYAVNPIEACAADVAQSPNKPVLSIADITGIIKIAMNQVAPQRVSGFKTFVKKYSKDFTSDGNVAVTMIGEEDGVTSYAVSLSCNASLIAGQLDVILPAGTELVDAVLTERATDHAIFRYDNSNGARLIIASMTNDEFVGNDGALLILRVVGEAPTVSGIVFADSESNTYTFGNPGTTGISTITDGAGRVKEAIYDAAGRAMRSIQRGINIIRHSDGTTTKEYRNE